MKLTSPFLATVCLVALSLFPVAAAVDDTVLLLIEGQPAQSTQFGYSGTGRMYKATGQTPGGKKTFSPSGGQVTLERNSTKDITNKSDYGTGGYVPPGVYFVHYHRLDNSIARTLPRHRLGMSDSIGEETIVVSSGGQDVTRTAIQFHVAFNDLQSFNAHVSEGCVTLSTDKFFQLFPGELFASGTSPLVSDANSGLQQELHGTGRVIAFITDATSSAVQDAQKQMFSQVVVGDSTVGLPANITNATVAALRTAWRITQ